MGSNLSIRHSLAEQRGSSKASHTKRTLHSGIVSMADTLNFGLPATSDDSVSDYDSNYEDGDYED